jgi:hypothetical protein
MINTPDQNLRELEGMNGGPITVLVAGQMYRMGQLTPIDYIEAAKWRAEQKVAALLSAIPANPIMDVSTIKAEACAAVLSKAVSPWDLLGDIEGVCRLAEIALRRGGEFKGPGGNAGFEFFKNNINSTSYQELESAVFRVSGFKVPDRKKDDAVAENPTMLPLAT